MRSPSIQEFLSEILELKVADVGFLWDIIREEAWGLPTEEASRSVENYFERYGWEGELSAYYTSVVLISSS